jgi:hypothetical protein
VSASAAPQTEANGDIGDADAAAPGEQAYDPLAVALHKEHLVDDAPAAAPTHPDVSHEHAPHGKVHHVDAHSGSETAAAAAAPAPAAEEAPVAE